MNSLVSTKLPAYGSVSAAAAAGWPEGSSQIKEGWQVNPTLGIQTATAPATRPIPPSDSHVGQPVAWQRSTCVTYMPPAWVVETFGVPLSSKIEVFCNKYRFLMVEV